MTIILFLSALLLSSVSEYFSIVGLITLFPTVPIPIAVMGVALGIGKLVSASFLYKEWEKINILLKSYLILAVVILSCITSLGIFGYLSKAHMDQNAPSTELMAKVELITEKIKSHKENIDATRKTLKQLDEAVNQIMGRSTDEKGAEKSVSVRRSQQKERTLLLAQIETEQKEINNLNELLAPISSEVRKIESEVGPIKYIAAFFYGDTDPTILEKSVTWVIIILILVFDPLAILLVISANISMKNAKTKRPSKQKSKISQWYEDLSTLRIKKDSIVDFENEIKK